MVGTVNVAPGMMDSEHIVLPVVMLSAAAVPEEMTTSLSSGRNTSSYPASVELVAIPRARSIKAHAQCRSAKGTLVGGNAHVPVRRVEPILTERAEKLHVDCGGGRDVR